MLRNKFFKGWMQLTYMGHDDAHVAGHDWLPRLDGITKQVVQCGGAAVFKHEVHYT